MGRTGHSVVTEFAPCPALITLNVDGQAEEIPVTLPQGIAPGARRVAITEEADVLAGV